MSSTQKTSILIVEDDMIIAANLSLQLTKLGYEISGIASRGEEAIQHARHYKPDIILMDINLRGGLDGIETAMAIQEFCDNPVVYLTANNDERTFKRACKTHPHAFISKPFNKLNLQRTLSLVVEQLKNRRPVETDPGVDHLDVLDDRIFVRHNGKMVRILLNRIQYIEADRNYCNIVTQDGNYLVVSTLKAIEAKLNTQQFVRVHRSFMVNINKLDSVAEGHLEINRKVIPLSKTHKELLLGRLQTI